MYVHTYYIPHCANANSLEKQESSHMSVCTYVHIYKYIYICMQIINFLIVRLFQISLSVPHIALECIYIFMYVCMFPHLSYICMYIHTYIYSNMHVL